MHPPVFLVPLSISSKAADQRESIVSFVRRLAEKNHLSVSTLLNRLIFPSLGLLSGRGNTYVAPYNHGIKQAIPFIAVIEEISRSVDLNSLTVQSLFELPGISYYGGVYYHKRWCPRCLQQDIRSAHGPYERLLWSLFEIDACATHNQRLVSTCPHCGASKTPLVTQLDCSGFCGKCIGWLGSAERSTIESKASPHEVWAAKQVASLIAQPPSPQDCHLRESMTLLADKHFCGVRQTFGDALGKSKATVSGWLNGKNRPYLRSVLGISYASQVPVLALLRCDKTAISRSKWRDLPPAQDRPARAKAAPRDVAADARFLIEVAEGRHLGVKTGDELRSYLEVAAVTLRRNCAAEYRLARAYQQAAIDEARLLARAQLVGRLEQKVREAHDSLAKACLKPTRRAILKEMERLGSRPVGRHDMPLVAEFRKRAADSGNLQGR